MRLFIATTLALAAVVSEVPAQLKPCASANDFDTNSLVMNTGGRGAANRWAFRYVRTAPLLVQGMKVFTGNASAGFSNKFEIWSDDRNSNLPGKKLADSATFAVPPGTPQSWLGANFDRRLVLFPATAYWFVWEEPAFSRPPWHKAPRTTFRTVEWDGSQWKARPSYGWMVRFYCNLVDQKNGPTFGAGCLAASGQTGTHFSNMEPRFNTRAYRIEGCALPPAAPAILIFGLNPNWVSIPLPFAPGCALNSDILFIFAGVTGVGDARARTARGHTQFVLPLLPPFQVGVFFSTQIAAIDVASKNPVKLVFTNAVRSTIF